MNQIKEELKERKIKQTWFVDRLGTSFCIVNSYACNRDQFSFEVFFEIAKIFQEGPKDLFENRRDS